MGNDTHPGQHGGKRGLRLIAGLFALLASCIVLIGWWYQRWQEGEFAAAAQQRLQAIAELKVRQISNWWQKRLDDAEYLGRSPFLRSNALAIAQTPDNLSARQQLREHLALLQTSGRYDQIVFFDRSGNPLFAIPDNPIIAPAHTRDEVLEAIRRRHNLIKDLQRDEGSRHVYLDLLIPVFQTEPAANPGPLGVVLLRIYAQMYLFPLVQAWPTNSPTAETLLVRQEGDHVVFLNEIRHMKTIPLLYAQAIPQTPQLPATMAVTGTRGVVEGVDYRGVPVLAALASIPQTPWAMVAKVDQEEVYAPLKRQAVLTEILTVVLIAAAGLLALLLWLREDRRLLRGRLELERVQQKLAARLLALTESSGDLILLTDSSLRITEANASARATYGITLSSGDALPLSQLFSPEFRPRLTTRAMDLIGLGKESSMFEAIMLRTGGEHFPAEISLSRLRLEEETYYQCIIRDCTERIRASEALRRSEEKLRAFFRSNVIGSVMGTISGGLVFVNDEFLRIAGYSREEIESGAVNWQKLTAPEFAQIEQLHIHEAMRRGSCTPYEKQYIRRDGTRIWVLVGFVIVGEKHEETVAFVLDISERKEAEAELLRVQEVLQNTQELGRVGSWEYDIARRATWASKETYRIFGVPHQDGYVQGDYFTHDILERDLVLQELERVAKGEEDGYHLEFTVRDRSDSHLKTIASTARLVRDASGKPVRILGFAQDITERKEAEQEIRQLNFELTSINRELEERVRQRTRELEERNAALQQSNHRILALSGDLRANNEQLQHTANKLAAANRELEAFSYSVSHDLRAPLRAIDGFSQALLEDYTALLDEQGRRYLDRLRAGAQRMGHLIDDLLKLSRVTRSEMTIARVDLTALAQEVVQELRESDPQRQVEFVLEPGLCANGDRALLRVALENILGNAWKFTSQTRQARIEFYGVLPAACPQPPGAEQASPAEASSATVQQTFCVRDNGAGFDMTYADKLFNAFQRMHNSRDFEGTGIGLATVQRVIARHGGSVRGEGEVNAGACFYFSLPCGDAPATTTKTDGPLVTSAVEPETNIATHE